MLSALSHEYTELFVCVRAYVVATCTLWVKSGQVYDSTHAYPYCVLSWIVDIQDIHGYPGYSWISRLKKVSSSFIGYCSVST
jgi:hypothetical protein